DWCVATGDQRDALRFGDCLRGMAGPPHMCDIRPTVHQDSAVRVVRRERVDVGDFTDFRVAVRGCDPVVDVVRVATRARRVVPEETPSEWMLVRVTFREDRWDTNR